MCDGGGSCCDGFGGGVFVAIVGDAGFKLLIPLSCRGSESSPFPPISRYDGGIFFLCKKYVKNVKFLVLQVHKQLLYPLVILYMRNIKIFFISTRNETEKEIKYRT